MHSDLRYLFGRAEQLGLEPDEVVTCGMSCGYEDEQAAVNWPHRSRMTLKRHVRL